MSENERHPLLTLLCWAAAGFALLFAHFGLVTLFNSVTVALGVTLTIIALLYYADAMAGFAVFLVFVLYQNLAISMISNSLNPELFHASQSTGFALTLILASIAYCRLWWQGENRNVLVSLGVAAAVILAYTAFGAVRSSPASAAVYFRNTSVALTGLLIGWDVGRRHGYRLTALCYLAVIAPGVGTTILELIVPVSYYETINAARYYYLSMANAMSVVRVDLARPEDVVAWLTTSFFNASDGPLHSIRFGGPNMHSVSYAYVLATGAIVAMSLGAYWFAVAILPLLFLVGAKGAAVLLIGTSVLSMIGRYFGMKCLAVSGVLLGATYIGGVIWYGLSVGDYHVIGLLGGINGFIQDPLGHGIGVGGNLSADVTSTDLQGQWNLKQLYGSDVALESAIGVLLYQMGIGGVAVAYIIWIAFASGVRHFRSGANVVPLAVAVVTVNGLFQEEVFSTYSIGLLTIFAAALSTDAPSKSMGYLHEIRYPAIYNLGSS